MPPAERGLMPLLTSVSRGVILFCGGLKMHEASRAFIFVVASSVICSGLWVVLAAIVTSRAVTEEAYEQDRSAASYGIPLAAILGAVTGWAIWTQM